MDLTLFVGIDVSKSSNHVFAMNFNREKLLSTHIPNTQDGAAIIESKLLNLLEKHRLSKVIIILESTGVYSAHLATYLSNAKRLAVFDVKVFIINPKISKNYRKSFADMDKTDPKDAFILADIASVGRTSELTPFKGSQRIALERLTRHRLHIAELLSTEKVYALNNVFLKFSSFESLFANNFGKTAVELLLEYKTINLSLASSINVINCYQAEMKEIDKAIMRQVVGFNQNHYTVLTSIPGIGKVYAAGILAEIADINQFNSDSALAKYAGITCRKTQSGNFNADDTYMTKTGNKYLRYFIIQAANTVRQYVPEYRDFYQKKFDEVTTHQHKRALALTARKLIRLIYSLLSANRLFQ